ncbi:MAG TPA: hypothetical protein DER32_07195 [Deinococcus radiodurans]|nr:hypothetical protein [Deinococcus radiodurans]
MAVMSLVLSGFSVAQAVWTARCSKSCQARALSAPDGPGVLRFSIWRRGTLIKAGAEAFADSLPW